MADATDLFRKGKSNFATTLAGGISDSDTTIPLSSAVGLPVDTAVTLTIDRVDSNGTSTTPNVERVTGVVSSTNLVSCLRGEDGTTPSSHGLGAVVEMIWDGETWNDAVEGILAEHNQDGTHKINTFQHLYAPEGFLLNGKIVPSVSSNNLTVAIKGMDGNDPSATNPVYVRIGDSIRSITSALSVTANAGTNWLGCGGSVLATKSVDIFVYLTLSGSDIGILLSRHSHANRYGELQNSTTAKSGAISSLSLSSNDKIRNIGRFAATLSSGSGYTWSVPTFTDDLLINAPILQSRWLEMAVVPVAYGGAVPSFSGTDRSRYRVDGNMINIRLMATNSSGGTAGSGGVAMFEMPFNILSSSDNSGMNPVLIRNGSVFTNCTAERGSDDAVWVGDSGLGAFNWSVLNDADVRCIWANILIPANK